VEDGFSAPFLTLQPGVLVAVIDGPWLLQHTTPSWRLRDPELGFQRIVKERRARDIALAVLDQGRSFPNAIVLATDVPKFPSTDGGLNLPPNAKFLVVDGQHRLWAQKFSKFSAKYACIIHTGLTEVDMARLFIEINNNQKRVPPSLRWDLVRLIQPDDDPFSVAASEIVYELATDEASPLYQRVDLTGEQGEITLKQASLAPEIRTILTDDSLGIPADELELQLDVFRRFFAGVRDVDRSAWDSGKSPMISNRIVRALIRLIPRIVETEGGNPSTVSPDLYTKYLKRIDAAALDPTEIRALQGSAGIHAIFETILTQVFSKK
jgi:DGQHR domain-containing protein